MNDSSINSVYAQRSVKIDVKFRCVREILFEKMTKKLYYLRLSPPARAVALTAAALGIELELIEVNLLAGEHYKPEFLKVS